MALSPRTPEQDALALKLVKQHCFNNGPHIMGRTKAATLFRRETGLSLETCRTAINVAVNEVYG